MDSSILIPFITASVLLAFMPGPDIIYIITLSISKGKKYGITTVLGLVSGVIIHTSFIAFGIAAIINKSDTLFISIKLFGALYMFFLAYKVFKSKSGLNLAQKNITQRSYFQFFRQGFIMNVLNPKVAIFFLAFFPGFIHEKNGNIILQIYILGFVFMITSFVVFSFVSILAARLTKFLRGNNKFEIILHWTQILVFIISGFDWFYF